MKHSPRLIRGISLLGSLVALACTASNDPGPSSPPAVTSPDAATTPPDVAPDLPPDAPVGLPASAGQADIAAFLMAGGYKQPPWISETSAPRARSSSTSPHEQVRVWMNDTLVASLKAGRDGFKEMGTMVVHPPHDRGSMAVKELWDEAGATLQGVAAMWKTEEGAAGNAWTYYCHGPDGRCLPSKTSPPEAPIFGRGTTVMCGFCHGGLVFTKAP